MKKKIVFRLISCRVQGVKYFFVILNDQKLFQQPLKSCFELEILVKKSFMLTSAMIKQ